MFYNFYLGRTAEVLSELLGNTVLEFQSVSYPLSEIESLGDGGLYFKKDPHGNLFRLGFYLNHYNNLYWNKSPSLHLEFCDNVRDLKHRMRATNSQVVTYYSRDNNTVYRDQTLKICRKCLALLREKTSIRLTGRSFNEFLLILEEDDKLKCGVKNKDGYAINWQQISQAFRETKNYKCEGCSFQLPDLKFSKFIQTHHINSYDKMNNKRSNLKCLCVKCHSEVDDYHRAQFNSFKNQKLLAEFEDYKLRL